MVDDDADTRFARILEDWGVRHIRRSAYMGDALLEAGLAHALAVVCVEVKEIHTLETALRIRETRPDVRMVVQLANPSVARALERVSEGAVCSTSPRWLVRRSWRHAWGAMRTISSWQACGSPWSKWRSPSPRQPIRHFADTLATWLRWRSCRAMGARWPNAPVATTGLSLATALPFSEPRRISNSVASTQARSPGRPFEPSPLRGGWHAGLRCVGGGKQGTGFVVAALLALIAVSTIILRITYRVQGGHGHLGLLSAAYFTVETVATVGYGDYSFASQDPIMRIYGILLIVIGVALVSTVFALFTNILVSRRIERSLGRRQVPGMVDHVVVIGLGSVGITVVQGLIAEGQRVVVIERDANNRYLAQARALGVPVVISDATQVQTHRMVNLSDASAVAVLTSADLTNIETGLAIRESLGERWEEVPVVLRVFDRDLARLMEQSFGFRHVRSTSALAAPWFVGSALGLDVLSTFYVDQQPFLVGRVTVAPQGGLQGLAMADLSARTRVIALSRAAEGGQLEHPPRRGTLFAGGDEAYLLGPYEELLTVLRRDQTPTP